VISPVYAFSRDAPSLSPTIQHSCLTSLVVEHFLIHWLQTSIPLRPKLMVWYCDKLSETLKTGKANSHPPSHCPPHLRANGQPPQAPNRPQPELQDQIKFPRISQLEYFRGHQKHTPSLRQSFHNPAGTWLARVKYDQSLVLMCVPPSVLEVNKNLTT